MKKFQLSSKNNITFFKYRTKIFQHWIIFLFILFIKQKNVEIKLRKYFPHFYLDIINKPSQGMTQKFSNCKMWSDIVKKNHDIFRVMHIVKLSLPSTTYHTCNSNLLRNLATKIYNKKKILFFLWRVANFLFNIT